MQEATYEEGKRLAEDHVCAECGAPLVLAWGGFYNIESYILRCGENPTHKGIVKRKTTTQVGIERLEHMGATSKEKDIYRNRYRKEKQ